MGLGNHVVTMATTNQVCLKLVSQQTLGILCMCKKIKLIVWNEYVQSK